MRGGSYRTYALSVAASFRPTRKLYIGVSLDAQKSAMKMAWARDSALAAGNDLSVLEGSQHTYNFSTSDAGADTFTLQSTSCGANGSQVGSATFNTSSGAGSFVCSFPDGPAIPG